jgi:hypothetical protein
LTSGFFSSPPSALPSCVWGAAGMGVCVWVLACSPRYIYIYISIFTSIYLYIYVSIMYAPPYAQKRMHVCVLAPLCLSLSVCLSLMYILAHTRTQNTHTIHKHTCTHKNHTHRACFSQCIFFVHIFFRIYLFIFFLFKYEQKNAHLEIEVKSDTSMYA